MTETAHPAVRPVRFGGFEIDLRAQQLRKEGLPLDLHGQPVRVLALLIEHAGQVVTREELRVALWGDNTFVDFDHGLHTAINRIREALGDSPRQPQFIETVPRIGYRFIAPLNGRVAVAGGAIQGNRTLRLSRLQHYWRLGILVLMTAAASAVLVWRWAHEMPWPQITRYVQLTHDGRHKEGLVSDGQRLYTVEESAGSFVLTQLSVNGGDTAPIVLDFRHPVLLDIAADGTQLLLMDQSSLEPDLPLWTLPLPGGALHRVGNLTAADAAWSPDGHWIAYSAATSLYRAKQDGTEPRRILDLRGAARALNWSPDSRTIRFTLLDANTSSSSLWQVAADGSHLRALLPGWGTKPRECCGRWTADGNYFVFWSQHDGKPNIWATSERKRWLRDADSSPVQITAGPVEFSEAVPARDGEQIFAIGQIQRGELVSYEAKTRQFTPYLSGLSTDGLNFSRDGQWIAYTSYPDGALWRSKSDGTDRRQLTAAPLHAALPSWSPDGQQIAFIGHLPDQPLKIFVVSADGGTPQQLIPEAGIQVAPTWLPDGSAIVFGTAWWLESKPASDSGIRIFSLRTHQVTTVPGSEGLGAPRVSPDGRYICAITQDLNTLKLFDVSKQRWSDLAHAKIMSPNWSHDNQYVYFNNLSFASDPAVFRVRVKDGRVERVVGLSGLIRVALGNWNPFMALTPDDRVLVLRDIGTQEIFSLNWHSRR
jgi:Tol biopolymer transport system component/DNA-binding winged helix-turn-helix (wHTH) protein